MYLFGAGFPSEGKLVEKSNIYHDTNNLYVSTSVPGQTKGLNIFGKDVVLYKASYNSKQEYCIYTEGASKTCKNSFGTINIPIDKASEVIPTLNNYSMTFKIEYTTIHIIFPMPI